MTPSGHFDRYEIMPLSRIRRVVVNPDKAAAHPNFTEDSTDHSKQKTNPDKAATHPNFTQDSTEHSKLKINPDKAAAHPNFTEDSTDHSKLKIGRRVDLYEGSSSEDFSGVIIDVDTV